MIINKYKSGEDELVIYGKDINPKLIEIFGLEMVEENLDLLSSPADHLIPIMSYEDLLSRTNPLGPKLRTRDKVLAEFGVDTFYDLQCAYNLVRTKSLENSTKRLREYIVEKYSEIMSIEYTPTTTNETEEEKTSE